MGSRKNPEAIQPESGLKQKFYLCWFILFWGSEEPLEINVKV